MFPALNTHAFTKRSWSRTVKANPSRVFVAGL
jgi:hypothetical protein